MAQNYGMYEVSERRSAEKGMLDKSDWTNPLPLHRRLYSLCKRGRLKCAFELLNRDHSQNVDHIGYNGTLNLVCIALSAAATVGETNTCIW